MKKASRFNGAPFTGPNKKKALSIGRISIKIKERDEKNDVRCATNRKKVASEMGKRKRMEGQRFFKKAQKICFGGVSLSFRRGLARGARKELFGFGRCGQKSEDGRV